MSSVEGGSVSADERLAEYILASDTERLGYQEHIENGGDPRDTIWYLALSVIGCEDEARPDIEEYEQNKKPMTQEEYLDCGGLKCPSCRSSSTVNGGPIEVDGPVAAGAVECEHCGSLWLDLYTLTGYSKLVEGET